MKRTLRLYKEDFRFGAAHFMIFDAQRAERLHGHNYRVRVNIGVPELGEDGFFVDFGWFKKIIRSEIEKLDEYILLPSLNSEIQTLVEGEEIEVRFRNRRYVFPKSEVLLVPLSNTSVEGLSGFLADKFFSEFGKVKVQWVEVEVEETPGQSGVSRREVE